MMYRLITLILLVVAMSFCSSTEKREVKDKDGKTYAWVQETETDDGKKQVRAVEYDKDRDGKVDHMINYDDQGQMQTVNVYKNQDEKNDFIVHYEKNEDKDAKKKYRRRQVDKLNENGEVVQTIMYHPNGKPAEVTVTKKNEKRTVYYDKNGKITSITKGSNTKEPSKK